MLKIKKKNKEFKCISKKKIGAISHSLDLLLFGFEQIDFSHLGEAAYLELIHKVEPLFRYARKKFKKKPNCAEFKLLYYKALSAKLGGHLSPQVFLDPTHKCFTRFIESNALQHKMQTLKIRVEQDEGGSPLILVFINEESRLIPWDSLTRRPIFTLTGKLKGYIFTYFDTEVFQTNANLRLDCSYILTYQGITKFHPSQENKIIAFDKRDPREWFNKYALEIWTLLKDGNGDRPTMGIGDHCHIILKDNKGYVYSMGKFGGGRRFKLADYMTLFAPKQGRFISPDFFSYYSESTRNLKKAQILISKAQFEQIYKKLSEHKLDKSPKFTLLKHNCASYVQNLLKEVLGLEIDSELYLPNYALRVLFPKRIYNYFIGSTKDVVTKCPKWLQKCLYFLPILYIPTMIVSLIIRLMSLGGKPDYSFKDIFIAPWNLTIHHPIALRESLSMTKN
ncbi:MAG: hypothetical protein P0S95_06375 [Rhabdochlamydiaceae bacterium]|nr:hypothetical protein [Candidatus Amphrikana amoebophyrae]